MKKRVLALTLAMCMGTSLLAGCGGGKEDTGAAPQKEEGASAESEVVSAMEELPEAIGEGEIVAVPEMYPNTDMSDPYTVNMYLIGDKPNDWDSVLEKVNTYLEPFNTDLAVTFMSWSDYQTMYSLVLAGGEQVDLIFTAPWCYMYTEAAKGLSMN